MDRNTSGGNGLGDLTAIRTWLDGQINRICWQRQRSVEPPIGSTSSAHHQNNYDKKKQTHSPTILEKTWEE
jgi:hypothetical protein